MQRVVKRVALLALSVIVSGCSLGKSDTFIFTADLPPNFYYRASAVYVPAKGETCTVPGGKNTHVGFNRHWRKEYKPDSEIALYRTVSGCPMVISKVKLEINAVYGDDWGDLGGDNASVMIYEVLPADYKREFSVEGESGFYGQCQFLFRTSGGKRRIVKILDCKGIDAKGVLARGRPGVAYTLDQLPGKTVKLKIKLVEEEMPAIKDTWVKVPNGWKRCMGDNFEDQYAFCYGDYKRFSSFMMPDGKQCTIYPGCTE